MACVTGISIATLLDERNPTVKNDDTLSREQLRQLLLDVLNSVADGLRLPKLVPKKHGDRKAEEDEPIN
jgi:hypothetical protein